MRQYTYSIIDKKTNKADLVRCTAPNPEWARLQVILAYGQECEVAESFCDIDPPHRILGEIDASDMTQADADWAAREIVEPNHVMLRALRSLEAQQ